MNLSRLRENVRKCDGDTVSGSLLSYRLKRVKFWMEMSKKNTKEIIPEKVCR